MKKLVSFLKRIRPWIWSEGPKGPTSYGVQVSFPWRDKQPTRSIHSWLTDIRDPDIKTKALVNYRISREGIKDDGAKNLAEALQVAFNWQYSPEGSAYWYLVWERAKEGAV